MSDATLAQLTEYSTWGSNVWRIIPNGSVNVVTELQRTAADTNGLRSEVTIYPDGSKLREEYQYGRLLSRTRLTPDGITQLERQTFGYDAFGRQSTITDARNGMTTYAYNAGDLVTSVTSPKPSLIEAAQVNHFLYDQVGRLTNTIAADGGSVTNIYYPNDLLKYTGGARSYPVEYTYDAQGRIATLKTWRDTANNVDALTAWSYNNRGFGGRRAVRNVSRAAIQSTNLSSVRYTRIRFISFSRL